MAGNDSVISDEEIIARWDIGESAASIARDVGLTRERIRQRLKRNGRTGPNPHSKPPARDILRAAEIAENLEDLAGHLDITSGMLDKALSEYKIKEEVAGILNANRAARTKRSRWAERGPLLQEIRALAASVGHTPTQDELEGIKVFHATLERVFGSAAAAMLAAGLDPNVRGAGPAPLPPGFGDFDKPTADAGRLDEEVDRLLNSGTLIEPPEGNKNPVTRDTTSTSYVRDPRVVAWVLQNAKGHCEACGQPGYETEKTRHFLEVHHMVPLSEGGPDVIQNAVAVCATCHGKLHRWVHRERLVSRLEAEIDRLS